MKHLFVIFIVVMSGCDPSLSPTTQFVPDGDTSVGDDANTSDDAGNSDDTGDGVEPVVLHSFGSTTLAAGEETTPCVSWTLNNDEALYVNKITLTNTGSFHHSNWFVVPEELYDGEDGFWRCRERGYDQFQAATQGTVIFAQSTQSREEAQKFPDGVVIKIPPRHKIVSDVHLLNISTQPTETELKMKLDLVHPRDVDVVVTPFRLTYLDLFVPANAVSRSQATCDIKEFFEEQSGMPFNMKLYWVLPHYHELGNAFHLSVLGGEKDGEVLYELSGFNAEANGKAFNPPVDLSGADGFNFYCGFNNPRDRAVGWGIGEQEMCVMLGFAEMDAIFDAWVLNDNAYVGNENGVEVYEGPCGKIVLPKNENQSKPTQEEIDGPLYVPDSDGTIDGTDIVDRCEDSDPSVAPSIQTSLTSISDNVFGVSCAFSSCHDATNPAFDLDLVSPGLHERLLSHEPRAQTDLPLVSPGNAEGSWLYQSLAKCDPGSGISPMPRNSPTLLNPGIVASVQAWIDLGANND